MYAIAEITDTLGQFRYLARIPAQDPKIAQEYVIADQGYFPVGSHHLISYHPDDQFAQVIRVEDIASIKKNYIEE